MVNMIVRGALTAAIVAAMAATVPALAGARGPASSATTRVYVSPGTGHPRTTFKLTMRVPRATGQSGTQLTTDTLTISGPDRQGCAASATMVLPKAAAGERVVVKADPRRHGGRWCVGTFHGRLVETISIICTPTRACPMVVVAPQTLARFHFRVR